MSRCVPTKIFIRSFRVPDPTRKTAQLLSMKCGAFYWLPNLRVV